MRVRSVPSGRPDIRQHCHRVPAEAPVHGEGDPADEDGSDLRGNGFRQKAAGAITLQVHDGDTINTRALGNLPIRFLGVDAPEVSLKLPGRGFMELADSAADAFLRDPLRNAKPFLDPGLESFIRNRLGRGVARNHARHAARAQAALEQLIVADMRAMRLPVETFEFYAVFAFEVMDRYGRLLCFINRNQKDPDKPTKRPVSYNERLLKAGVVAPYFIWPNVNPFRKAGSVADAVFAPRTANHLANSDAALVAARKAHVSARRRKVGIFDAKDPLRLDAFELRFLAGRRPPDRWVIDLSTSDDVLVPPQRYYEIAHAEDRLFIPREYVSLFVEAGWRRGQP